MKTPDLLLPFQSTAVSTELESPARHHASAKPAEPFDKMMNRALARPAREAAEKNSPVKKPAGNPVVIRKPKAAVGAESNPGNTAAAADFSSRDPLATKPEGNSSGQSSDSSTAADTGKDSPNAGTSAAATTADNSAALQALAASVAANQTTPTAPVISKTAAPEGEIRPLEMVGTKIYADPISTSAVSGNAPARTESDLKSDPKAAASDGKKLSSTETGPAKKSSPDGGAIPIQALLGQGAAADETPANKTDSAPEKPHALTGEAAGISAAQQTATMKNADQAAKVAGMPEQSLPGVTLVASAVQEAFQEAFRPRPSVKAAARIESPDSAAPISALATNHLPATVETSSSSLISASSQTELRTRALDRTHDIMALHGLQLRQSNTDSLHVIIKPGAGLQLSLQMKQTSEGIEAQAVLQSGNFNDLNQHWAELQQRLEERGIKLAPLGNESATANSGNENSQRQSYQSAPPDALSAGAFAEFAAGSAAAPRTTPTTATADARGWESWA